MASDQNHAEKVVFTPEQQAKVDEIVNEAMGRAGKDARAEALRATERVKELEATINELKSHQPQQPTKVSGNGDGDNGRIAALEAQIAEMKDASKTALGELERFKKIAADKDGTIAQINKQLVSERKVGAISKAAEPNKFVSLDAVYQLTEKFVQWDEERNTFIVLNDKGGPRLNAAYEPMSLEEFYVDFAAKNPWVVRGDATPGAGSTESKKSSLSVDGKYRVEDLFGPKSDSAKANALAMSDKKEYLRLRKIAQESGLI